MEATSTYPMRAYCEHTDCNRVFSLDEAMSISDVVLVPALPKPVKGVFNNRIYDPHRSLVVRQAMAGALGDESYRTSALGLSVLLASTGQFVVLVDPAELDAMVSTPHTGMLYGEWGAPDTIGSVVPYSFALPSLTHGMRVACRALAEDSEPSTVELRALCRAVAVHQDMGGPTPGADRLVEELIERGWVQRCDHCSAIEVADDLTTVRIGEDRYGEEQWCGQCVEDHATTCDDCGELWANNQLRRDHDSNDICPSCIDDHYTTCESCGGLFDMNSSAWENGEDGCCESCTDARREEEGEDSVILDYSEDVLDHCSVRLKPGVRYFGAEIEAEVDRRREWAAENVNDRTGDKAILKSDGSLNEGFEIVTVPMTLKDWQSSDNCILDACDWLSKNGGRSHNTSTCGLHIHVSRETLTEPTIAKLVMFMNDTHNAAFLTKLARRSASTSYAEMAKKKWTSGRWEWEPDEDEDAEHIIEALKQMVAHEKAKDRTLYGYAQGSRLVRFVRFVSDRYKTVLVKIREDYWETVCPDTGSSVNPEAITLDSIVYGTVSRCKRTGVQENQGGRYTPLNLANEKTIEFRVFRGTLLGSTIVATVELCDALCNWAAVASTSDLTHEAFMRWAEKNVTRKTYPALTRYMIARGVRTARPVPEKFKKEKAVLVEA